MKRPLHLLLIGIMAICVWSCKSGVDLDNIDPSMKVRFGAALPVGEISATIGDFINGEQTIVYVREDGVLCFKDSMKMNVSLDDIDLTQYFNNVQAELTIADKLPAELPAGYGVLVGDGTPITLEFPIGLSLGGINQPGANERIDSAIITSAVFNTVLTQKDMNLPFNKIESVDLLLPAEMHRAAGNVISAPLEGKNYGDQLPLVIDNFVLDLIQDHSLAPADGNVLDSVTLTLRIVISLEVGEMVTISSTSAFEYNFRIGQLDYTAIFGYFKPTALDKTEKQTIDFSESLPIWESIGDFSLPFADPRIDFTITTGIAAPIGVNIVHLSTIDKNTKEQVDAKFNGSTSTDIIFENVVRPDDPLNAVATNVFSLSKDPAEGQIDQLFTIQPEKLEIEYKVKMQNDPTFPQYRLTKNSGVDIRADLSMPFTFNKGLNLTYTDTIADIKLTQASLDSLTANVDMIDSVTVNTISLVLLVRNTLPFDVLLNLRFFDDQNQPLDLNVPDLTSLGIPAPTGYDPTTGAITMPGEKQVVISFDNNTAKLLTKLNKIIYSAQLKDSNITPTSAYPIKLQNTSSLALKMGVTADVNAYLRVELNKANNQNTNQQ